MFTYSLFSLFILSYRLNFSLNIKSFKTPAIVFNAHIHVHRACFKLLHSRAHIILFSFGYC
jgi:hypothetical protein